jgi:hypothetical protein
LPKALSRQKIAWQSPGLISSFAQKRSLIREEQAEKKET